MMLLTKKRGGMEENFSFSVGGALDAMNPVSAVTDPVGHFRRHSPLAGPLGMEEKPYVPPPKTPGIEEEYPDEPDDNDGGYEMSLDRMSPTIVRRVFNSGRHTTEYLLHGTVVGFVDASTVGASPPSLVPQMNLYTAENRDFLLMPHDRTGARLNSVAYGLVNPRCVNAPDSGQDRYIDGPHYWSRTLGHKSAVYDCTVANPKNRAATAGSDISMKDATFGMYYSRYRPERGNGNHFRLKAVKHEARTYIQMWPLAGDGSDVVRFVSGAAPPDASERHRFPFPLRMAGTSKDRQTLSTLAAFDIADTKRPTSTAFGLDLGDFRIRRALPLQEGMTTAPSYMMTGPSVRNMVSACAYKDQPADGKTGAAPELEVVMNTCDTVVPPERSTWAVHALKVGTNLRKAYLDELYRYARDELSKTGPSTDGRAPGAINLMVDCCTRFFGGRADGMDPGGEAECKARGFDPNKGDCNVLMTKYCASEAGKADPLCGCAPDYPAIKALPDKTRADGAIKANPQCFNTPSCSGQPNAFRFLTQRQKDGSTYCPSQVFCEAAVGATDDSLISDVHVSQCQNPESTPLLRRDQSAAAAAAAAGRSSGRSSGGRGAAGGDGGDGGTTTTTDDTMEGGGDMLITIVPLIGFVLALVGGIVVGLRNSPVAGFFVFLFLFLVGGIGGGFVLYLRRQRRNR